jgi:serine beta-lactamase-like protein LACTB, mitochondrial
LRTKVQSICSVFLTPALKLGLVHFRRRKALTKSRTCSGIIFLVIIFLIISPAQISYSQSFKNYLDNFLHEYQTNKNVPSISGGVSLNGKIAWLGAVGLAEIENDVPAKNNTLYRIASISKAVTSVAIMQLVEQDKIKLDEDVRTYLPYFPNKKSRFTVRQLLNHTSGIRNYRYGEFNSTDSFKSIKDAIRTVMDDSLQFEPGTKREYTTLGYNLLAGIIENVSGMSFEEYLNKNIFQPAEMNSTYLEYQPKIIYNKARGYIKNNFRKFENAALADLSIKFPGGGIISTCEDLLKFSQKLISFKLVKSSTLDTMLIPTITKNKDTVYYGLGVSFSIDEKGRKFFGHSGGGTGFTGELIIYPGKSLAAVYLTNVRDRNLDNPAKSFVSIVLDNNYEIPKKSLADRLLGIYAEDSIDSSLLKLEQLSRDSSNTYKIDADEFIVFGYDLISTGNYPDAIYYFKYLISKKDNFAKYYVGLADAYYKDGNKGLALRNFRHAVNLDSKNKYAQDMIKKIENE